MRKYIAALAVASLLGLGGCAGVGLTLFGVGAGTAASAGVNHTLSGIAYKTFSQPEGDVRRATVAALDGMAMKVEKEFDIENGFGINAAAHERVIEIELERLTRKTTRMRVTVKEENGIFRDSATATEIIVQTATVLEAQIAANEKRKREARLRAQRAERRSRP
jgi:hypothetical protein